jgi:5-methylcytosine-specific restriction protein A
MLPFISGRTYRRRDIHADVGGQGQGGISTPSRHPLILLFSGEQGEQYGYHDGFQDDGSFWYTGEGQIGDMQMIRGNRAIFTHLQTSKALHLFQYETRGLVKYEGQAIYTGHHYASAPDRNSDPRQVIVFELAVDAPAAGVPDLTPIDVELGPRSLWQQPMKDLKQAAFAQARIERAAAARNVTVYFRSDVIKVYVLRRANGYCEGCGAPAPFLTRKGTPYLEPHHIRRRADSGPDHPLWVIALCANCHKRVHYGADGHDYNMHLADRVAAIENL